MRRLSTAAFAGLLLLAFAAVANAAVVLEREFRFDTARLKISHSGELTQVDVPGAARESAPGRPDLPWLSERVDLPAGQRIARVEVIGVDASLAAERVKLLPTIEPKPGLGPILRTAPDPAYFDSPFSQPEQLVVLGVQGSQRGRQIGTLRVSPVRWNPRSGRLEQVKSVRVRLTLEPDDSPVTPRERIVREWEDELPTGVPTRAFTSISTPAGEKPQATPFRPTQVPSVLGSPVEYVIVTNDAMAPTFQQLADWKTQTGVPAVVRTMSFIQAQYPFGADDAERVRLFIRDAYSRWGTKWVLLGGDTDVIPERQARTTFYGGEMIAADMYFSCVDGNWNADGDSLFGEGYYSTDDPGDNCDILPEVYVGRAPTSTVAEALQFVTKTLTYVNATQADYQNAWLFFSEVLFPQDWSTGQLTSLDGAELSEDILPIADLEPAIHVGRLYQNYTDIRWRPTPVQETRARVLDSLDVGYNIAVHTGHGYRNVMSVGDDNMTNGDVGGLSNGNRLTNLYAINCTSNAIDFPCIGEAFLKAPNGGAVTNVGSTRFDFPSTGRAYQEEYFRLMVEDSISAVGELTARQKLPFIAFASYDGVQRWTQMTLLMLGDPELRIFRTRPRVLTVVHPSSMAVSDTQIAVNVAISGVPLYGARVTAYKANDDFATGTTDGAGNIVLPFRPDSVGTFKLTVTAYNAKPYQASPTITASGVPLLADRPVVLDDDAVGGTVGNANGQLDAGETVDLIVPLKNNGGANAPGVTATLSTTDGLVTIITPAANYGTINAGSVVPPSAGFRASFPYTLTDQREVPFTLDIIDTGGHHFLETFQMTVRAPELRHYSHVMSGTGGNGRPDPGENVSYQIILRNNGTGIAEQVSAKLRSYDGLATVSDSSATFGNIAAGASAQGDAVTFNASSIGAKLSLVVSDRYGELFTKALDLSFPAQPISLIGLGAATSIALSWAHNVEPDLLGYNIYRSPTSGGTYARINSVPTDRTSYYLNSGLSPLTRYYYKVAAVDSSGNESLQSLISTTSTNPPAHTIFPIPTGGNTPSSVALEYIYQGSMMDIVAGSEVVYVLHGDGTAPVDGDGAGNTLGDFSTRGKYFAAGPSVANLDGTGWSIIAPSWDSTRVYVFDKQGNVRPGWPFVANDAIWSSAAIGDLDNNGSSEIAFGSNNNRFYVLRANGSEWIDGDANGSTQGVFKVLGQPYNFGTPALADIDMNGELDIVYGSYDGKLYAWRPSGANLPGFPVQLQLGGVNTNITSSAAVGFLDGVGDPFPEIVVAAGNESLYVFQANGTRRPGWPVWIRTSGTSKIPSPALADINNDGFLDVVYQSTNGGVYVYNRTGAVIPPFSNLRYSVRTSGASESSPVVADMNGDGFADMLAGDEEGVLTAFSGANGQVLPGFPIQLQGEVRGAAAIADVDGDGKTEIVLSGWDKNVYCWDYDFPFSPSGPPPWPQFHHDARRTGFFDAPLYVGVNDDPAIGGAIPAALEFAPPAPNPSKARTRLEFSIPSASAGETYSLAIYDLSGRRVRLVDSGRARPGRFSLTWDLRDERGSPVDGGVYFARFTLGTQSVTHKSIVMR